MEQDDGLNLVEDAHFWELADQLVDSSEVVIDRPRGTSHPRFPELIYPLDYGYLSETTVMGGGGVDVWLGSLGDHQVTGALLTVDTQKRDAEVKFLLGCTFTDAEIAWRFHQGDFGAATLVLRGP